MNFKQIHIGSLIKQKVGEDEIDSVRICKFLHCDESDLQNFYSSKSMDAEILLSWSKLLKYDFFRIYSQHLVLFAPQQKTNKDKKVLRSHLPDFKKSLYTVEIINFIMEQISTGVKTKAQIIDDYKIPKTTLHKWLTKYQNTNVEKIK